MITLSGTASHVQNTISVSGGAGESAASTTYICLFRIHGAQFCFKSARPLSVADGDKVVVAGVEGSKGLSLYAVRNLTTGVSMSSGVASYLVLAGIISIAGLFFANATFDHWGIYSVLIALVSLGCAGLLFRHGLMARSALAEVDRYRG